MHKKTEIIPFKLDTDKIIDLEKSEVTICVLCSIPISEGNLCIECIST